QTISMIHERFVQIAWLASGITVAILILVAIFTRVMARQISGSVQRLGSLASSLAAASEQLRRTVDRVSQGGRIQNTSVETTSSTLEELGASLAQNAEHSGNTESLATKGAQDARQSGQAVQHTVDAMHQIAEKVGVIGDIAYQTNLLALNAAIEA